MSSQKQRSVCVFCGARSGFSTNFGALAEGIGSDIATAGWQMVYGGGGVGLMGIIATHCLKNGGSVVGVMPEFLTDVEPPKLALNELILVPNMAERKIVMEHRSDLFLALPGGFGTFDEIFEMVTLSQLGQHHKPVLILNFENYFDPLFEQIAVAVKTGFIEPAVAQLLVKIGSREEFRDYLARM